MAAPTIRALASAAALAFLGACAKTEPQADAPPSQPVINAHMHASWPAFDDAEYRAQVVQEMRDNNIVLAVLHVNEPSDLDDWSRAEPGLFVAGPAFPCPTNTGDLKHECFPGSGGWPPLDWLEQGLASGDIGAFGEMLFNYVGIAPDDPRMDPYWALAAKYDVPVFVHINRGPPAQSPARPDNCCPDFDADMGNPALLRPVLEKHPSLRISLQHAGFPALPRMGNIDYWDETLSLMRDYPNVYADMTILNSIQTPEVHAAALQRFVAEGFADRIMFGTDNMPAAPIIARLEGFSFLTAEQRRGILHDNAARFLRLGEEQR
ncbi:MAG: amidohydrolase family protein [Pseudomonadota bacterium]|nr:amidohydrolase family protein [Pseudomonadota bacterium]